jgi:hypothetical protein
MTPTPSSLAELCRLAIVFLHLIACCTAIGTVLLSDIGMVKQLLSRKIPPPTVDKHHLLSLQNIVLLALLALWISGAAIVAFDMSYKGTAYLGNPKLQAKILVVTILSLNGAALHYRVLPWLLKAGSLLKLSFRQTMLSVFAGSLSGVSWFYAAMLGVGKPLSWKYSLLELLGIYPVLVLFGFFGMVIVVTWCKFQANPQHLDFSATEVFKRP